MNLKLVLSLAAVASVVAAKNVVNLGEYQDENNYDRRMGADKRDAKNIADLERFKQQLAAGKESRDAKNIADLEALKHALDSKKEPRDAKNIADLERLKQALDHEKENHKREAKNTYAFKTYEGSSEERDVHNIRSFEVKSGLSKRGTKKSFDMTAFEQVHHPSDQGSADQVIFTLDSADCHANLLESILPQIKSVSIFAGYVRDYEEVSHKTELTNETMLIIAPSDEAIDNKLNGLKPWEFPVSLDGAENEDDIVQQNLESFVNHHVVLNFEQNLEIDEVAHSVVAKLKSGDTVAIKQDSLNGKFTINTNNGEWITVDRVQQVDNGFLFVINDVLTRP